MENIVNENMISQNYDLIVAIVNKGYLDLVMEAAKEAGARGGTTFNARGTGSPDLAKFFGIPIEPEKEIAFILVDEKIKDNVLLKIYENAGLDTKGAGIAFAIKVDDVIGLTPLNTEETKKEEEVKEEQKVIKTL